MPSPSLNQGAQALSGKETRSLFTKQPTCQVPLGGGEGLAGGFEFFNPGSMAERGPQAADSPTPPRASPPAEKTGCSSLSTWP